MYNRTASLSDIPDIMRLVSEARVYLASQGLNQWQGTYPEAEVFARDIKRGECHVFSLTEGGDISGVAVITTLPESCYCEPVSGAWGSTGEYISVHRVTLGSAARSQGLSGAIFSLAEKIAREKGIGAVRVDTHEGNKPMRAALLKYGFNETCVIVLDSSDECGQERIGYELLL